MHSRIVVPRGLPSGVCLRPISFHLLVEPITVVCLPTTVGQYNMYHSVNYMTRCFDNRVSAGKRAQPTRARPDYFDRLCYAPVSAINKTRNSKNVQTILGLRISI